MSREAMEAVSRHSVVARQDVLARAVLDVIARLTGPEGGEVWPALRTIAEEARCDKDTVTRKVKVLEEAGEVSTRREGKGRGARTYYRLLLPLGARVGDEDAPRRAENREVVYTAVEGQDLAAEVVDLRRQLAELQATVTRLTAVVYGGFNVPTEPESPPHWPEIVPLMSPNVPSGKRSMGTIPPPPPLFDGDINGVNVPILSPNVPTDQTGMGTIGHGDINDYCPQECPQMSPTMSPNVPTLQRAMGTETNRNQDKPFIIKTTGSEPIQKDPAVQNTWSELRAFLGGLAEEKGLVWSDRLADERAGAVWSLMKHFCVVGGFGPIPLDTAIERAQLWRYWWPFLHRWLEASEWDVVVCQEAMSEAIVELRNWERNSVSSPKSLSNKMPAILAARKSGVKSTAVVEVDKARVQVLFDEIRSKAGIMGELPKIFAKDPLAKLALRLAQIDQSRLQTMSTRDVPFVYKQFEEAYQNASASASA